MANDIKLSAQLEKILDEFGKEAEKDVYQAFEQVGKETVNKLKQSSPKKSGDYAKGWRFKWIKERGKVIEGVVHNSTHYQLTHLLENGHDVYNYEGGSYGRTRGIKHIQPADDWAQNELDEEIRRRLEK